MLYLLVVGCGCQHEIVVPLDDTNREKTLSQAVEEHKLVKEAKEDLQMYFVRDSLTKADPSTQLQHVAEPRVVRVACSLDAAKAVELRNRFPCVEPSLLDMLTRGLSLDCSCVLTG